MSVTINFSFDEFIVLKLLKFYYIICIFNSFIIEGSLLILLMFAELVFIIYKTFDEVIYQSIPTCFQKYFLNWVSDIHDFHGSKIYSFSKDKNKLSCYVLSWDIFFTLASTLKHWKVVAAFTFVIDWY